MYTKSLLALAMAAVGFNAAAQPIQQTTNNWRDAFRQLEDEDWPTPNRERRATGAPGPDYWQQDVDYRIQVRLDEDDKRLFGSETVIYTNNAPDTLDFLWFQLDQNRFRADSIAVLTETVGGGGRSSGRVGGAMPEGISAAAVRRRQQIAEDGYGHNITAVTDADGNPVDYTIVDTLMRIDLDDPLETGESVELNIEWDYRLIETGVIGGRAGWECFEETDDTGGDCIYQIAQWFPRAAAFSDYEGWHNKAFLGRGEFTLEFGDYDVSITVPQDFIVAATGELQNPEDVLNQAQRDRLEQARTADEPVFIVTPSEARANERRGTRSQATWSSGPRMSVTSPGRARGNSSGMRWASNRTARASRPISSWRCPSIPTKANRSGRPSRPARSSTRSTSIPISPSPIPIRSRNRSPVPRAGWSIR